MLTLDDVSELACVLPEVTVVERESRREWTVAGKAFAWQRSFSKADLKRFGDVAPPAGIIVAVRTADLNSKAALLENPPPGFFTIPHFDGYPAVLVQLKLAGKRAMRQALIAGWTAIAPDRLKS